jgi:integrase/recombinase XerD
MKRPAPREPEAIVSAAAVLPSHGGLRGLTFSTLFGLLAVTGMRIGEVVALDRDYVDLQVGVLNVREGKLGKQRFVPIHTTTRQALAHYAARRTPSPPA